MKHVRKFLLQTWWTMKTGKISLTKFRFLWKLLNLFVRKYFGRTSALNLWVSLIWKARPVSLHLIIPSELEFEEVCAAEVDSDSIISYSRRGNCCGTPRFPVFGILSHLERWKSLFGFTRSMFVNYVDGSRLVKNSECLFCEFSMCGWTWRMTSDTYGPRNFRRHVCWHQITINNYIYVWDTSGWRSLLFFCYWANKFIAINIERLLT